MNKVFYIMIVYVLTGSVVFADNTWSPQKELMPKIGFTCHDGPLVPSQYLNLQISKSQSLELDLKKCKSSNMAKVVMQDNNVVLETQRGVLLTLGQIAQSDREMLEKKCKEYDNGHYIVLMNQNNLSISASTKASRCHMGLSSPGDLWDLGSVLWYRNATDNYSIGNGHDSVTLTRKYQHSKKFNSLKECFTNKNLSSSFVFTLNL